MQVLLESTSSLGRRMTVEVPPERIDPEVEKRLKSMSRRVKVAGFRPGKVPFRIVKQRFGEQVLQEVTDEVLRASFKEAVAQKELRPAGGPQIEPSELGDGRGLKYTATFEVYPEFELASLEDLEIKRPMVEITETDIDRMIENLCEQRKTWNVVDRPAQKGDQVLINFNGFIDGAPIEGGEGKDVSVELGSGRMLSDFEDRLIGARPEDDKKIQVSFPSDYPNAALAGQTADFEVKIKRVSEPKLPVVDDKFAKSFGVAQDGVEGLRKAIRANLEREREQRIEARIMTQVMDGLLQRNEVELPETMIKHEIARIRRQAMDNSDETDEGRVPDELFAEEARRRVKLGLIVGEIVRRHGLKPDGEKVQNTLQALASSYENPQQVIDYYRHNRAAMANIEAMVIENQVVDWILTRCKTKPEVMSFAELVNPPAPAS
jgi:trigger factor